MSESTEPSTVRRSTRAKKIKNEDEEEAEVGTMENGSANTKSRKSSGKKGSKKESFKWSTPADEFADDVGSDAEDDGEYLEVGDGEKVIIIGEGSSAQKYTLIKGELTNKDGETNEDIARFMKDYDNTLNTSGGSPVKKKTQSKHRFPCPKCDKVWSWPWELRRHVLTHYKEVSHVEQIPPQPL